MALLYRQSYVPVLPIITGGFPGNGIGVGFFYSPTYVGDASGSGLTVITGSGAIGGGTAGSPNVVTNKDFIGTGSGASGTPAIPAIDNSYITFRGCRFQSNSINNFNTEVNLGTNIRFEYCTFVPYRSLVTAPPNAAWPSASAGTGINTGSGSYLSYVIDPNNSYQAGCSIGTAAPPFTTTGPVTLDHCDIWGFGNSIIFNSGMSQQMTINQCWIHDAASIGAPTLYHTDGPGYLQGGPPPSNISVTGCTIAFIGNTNCIALQQAATLWSAAVNYGIGNTVAGSDANGYYCKLATGPGSGGASDPTTDGGVHWTNVGPNRYNNITVTGNYLSGNQLTVDMGHLAAGNTNLTFSNNTLATDINFSSGGGFLYTDFTTGFNGSNNTWRNNLVKVYTSDSWSGYTAIQSNQYLWPVATLSSTALHVIGAAAGAGGVVRLNISPAIPGTPTTSGYMLSGDCLQVVGVNGTTEANGTWQINVIDSTHIDLLGTTFVHAWTSGGSFGLITHATDWTG